MEVSRLHYLLDQYTRLLSTKEEEQELMQRIADPAQRQAAEDFLDRFVRNAPVNSTLNPESSADILEAIFSASPGKLVPLQRRRWRWVAAAAAVIIFLVGGYWFFESQKSNPDSYRDKTQNQVAISHDIKAPSTNRAMITLADGKKVYLDSANNGTLASQDNINIIKTGDGQIIYHNSTRDSRLTTHDSRLTYNTLTNPRGSKVIDMKLSDGTHVWLNAGSSITYPVAFVSNERKVSITGEAYFEVSHDAGKPFYVSKGDVQVQVLGTHFNVNAYDDEQNIRVTLLEGRVKVQSIANSQESIVIKPGQQALATSNHKLQTINDVDVQAVMAWKNGKFDFGEKTDIQTIMRQLARWYDVDVEYKGNVNGFIGGSISRDVNVSTLLSMLEKTGEIKFSIEGKKITVLP